MKFRSQNEVVDAIQWTGDNFPEVKAFIAGRLGCLVNDEVDILSTQGNVVVRNGHYITKAPQGSIFVYDPETFRTTFTKAEAMRLALIYDPTCPKLLPTAYSQTYRDQFLALCKQFRETTHITKDCSAQDIDADVIVIYDIHSSHHIEIHGLKHHPAIKYTYFNDPHQQEFKGQYRNGPAVHKLGAEARTHRALDRGVDFIICPYQDGYFQYIAPHIGPTADKMLFWFPPAPSITRFPFRGLPLIRRRHKILGNGILHGGGGAYDFRKWAYSQPETFYVKHAMDRPDVPQGMEYGKLLTTFAASLALCDWYVVPKYQEIPLAGCVCFAQYQMDYADMGFKDGENCILVTKENFQGRTEAFLNDPMIAPYQKIATAGRELIEARWTAERFAEALYKHAENQIQSCQTQGATQ